MTICILTVYGECTEDIDQSKKAEKELASEASVVTETSPTETG